MEEQEKIKKLLDQLQEWIEKVESETKDTFISWWAYWYWDCLKEIWSYFKIDKKYWLSE